MAITLTVTPVAANSISAVYSGAATGGASIYYGANTVDTTDATAIDTAIANHDLTLAGTGTTASKTVAVIGLAAETLYKIVAKDADGFAVQTATTLKAKDIIPGDDIKNLLETTTSNVTYTNQTANMALETGKYVSVLVVQTPTPVTDAIVAGWLDNTDASFQITAGSNVTLPVITGLTPTIRVTSGVTYNNN